LSRRTFSGELRTGTVLLGVDHYLVGNLSRNPQHCQIRRYPTFGFHLLSFVDRPQSTPSTLQLGNIILYATRIL
jgi:hypothetical protein